MKKLFLIGMTAIALAMTTRAQTFIGQVITYQGQNFLIATNSSGGYTVSTFGVQGTNIITAPVSADQAMAVATQMMEQNNPANIGYYRTNEWDASLGAGYIQNSGQAVALIELEKYGLFGWPNFGLGGGVLQGNNQGKSGTAGAYGEALYRKPIGDVAGSGGFVAGYDNWNARPFVGGKVKLEYRQNPHLGEFVSAAYAFENVNNDRGLLLFAGINYSF